ncbi:hypothetical protein [Arthrobacter sp. 31Y]|uniref:hypothetical protein n=1 Tax=Arthrobacter sp. 31Y TaxID=1115632 RepID=UPI000466AF0B|nr:hypothetical protein [Arthrobacter sp. 31Y]
MSEVLAWPNPHEMEYSIQLELDGYYWDWDLGGQKWFPLETILHQQKELAKPIWLHLGYRVIERRKAGPPRVVSPDQLKDAVRLAYPEAPRPFESARKPR